MSYRSIASLSSVIGALVLALPHLDGCTVTNNYGETDSGVCDPSACGPALGMPNWRCPDGSWGGPTGRCLRLSDGKCGWEVRQCPPTKTCGAVPDGGCDANLYCKHELGQCLVPGNLGQCFYKPEACTSEWSPVCGCDGMTYSSACVAAGAGQSVMHAGECTSRTCKLGDACGANEYCKVDDGACLSTGPTIPTGSCAPRPSACDLSYAPVCGCDGKTYGNACGAAAAGQNVATKGACGSKTCGGIAGIKCAAAEYCNYPDVGACGVADASGVCRVRPTACTKEYAPVCGCDGITYGNACVANMAGTDVAAKGVCK